MAKKRHHHEAMGDKKHMAKKSDSSYYKDYYSGLDPRRRMERMDGAMLNEDHMAVANMPQDVKYHPWPAPRHYANYGLDDTISGIDHQMDKDGSEMDRHLQPEKY